MNDMEPMMQKKREVAALLPYRKSARGFEFFLQQREVSAHVNSGLLDLFGGGTEEGETLEETLRREIQEELEYTPQSYVYFSRYENATHVCHVFLEAVDDSFEDTVHVHEGLHGKFFTVPEAEKEKIFEQTLMVLKEVSKIVVSH